MSAYHRSPVRLTAPESFQTLAAEILAAERAAAARSFLPERYEFRRGAIERLLNDQAVIVQAIKMLRVDGGAAVLRTAITESGRLPERAKSLDARTAFEKRQYLEKVQDCLRALVSELDFDRPRTSELYGVQQSECQWPTHPFFRESLLEDSFSAPFRIGTFIEPMTGREEWQKAKGRFPLSRLHRILNLADKALDAKLAALLLDDSVPQKGHGVLRGLIHILDDALSEFDHLFVAHPRRLSRNAIIVAFINASYAVPANAQLDQKYVHNVRKRRSRHSPED